MKHPSRSVVLLLLLAASLAPAAARPGEDPACRLADDAPAFVCTGAGTFRAASVVTAGRGYVVYAFAFTMNGAMLPSAETVKTSLCLFIVTPRGSYTETCRIPADVSIDPLLDSASIKGRAIDRALGAISIDITVIAGEGLGVIPGAVLASDAGCADAVSRSNTRTVGRRGETRGTITIGRTQTRPAGSTWLSQWAGSDTSTTLSAPCANERAAGDPEAFAFLDCVLGVGPFGIADICNGSWSQRSVTVRARNAAARITMSFVESTSLHAEPPDPTWIAPSEWGPHGDVYGCLRVAVKGRLDAMCDNGFEIEMDPQMGTTRVKGAFDAMDAWDGYYLPQPFPYGRVRVDVTAAIDDKGLRPVGRTRSSSFLDCDGVFDFRRSLLAQGEGTATGTVAFQRRLGTVRGTAARPLPSAMDWEQRSVTAMFGGGYGCAEHEDG
ncbi:MAG TPA: hypothetical protein VM841_11505 [Actinomycetota bacterium]|nr:hypothetical protein [Actinomycetota bacterium]